ncbi:hypothetical protein MJO28_015170 [Puccinia striiformis f. sp. tritici]|uniref:Uncharacterized protein n=2 Tax=Puccinia striiformis f. sp. tritici TaxID=168172 RepID=A0ACC0DTT2_9BASI|nr:hypothetical protein Pst134EA_028006 [Puccinia striiformis f. sp. tritici]KAH9448713.1 hypothetical protein Pst134EA_028006 [Puccinia striiformis f. sp. tritici]KAI7938250.1 hypothetical protein MJO28_015170 [Puccinia striiformis f. sp. tritici]
MSDAKLKTDASEELDYLHMGYEAAAGGRLSDKYRDPDDQNRDAIPSEFELLSMDATTKSKERLFNDLQYHLLPALHLHLTNISRILTPSYLCARFEGTTKRVLGIHLETERMIDSIRSHINLLCPVGSIPKAPHRDDDQHHKQFKSFRLRSLRAQFAQVSRLIFFMLREAYSILKDLIIRPETNYSSPYLSEVIVEVFDYINCTIECLKGSELDIVQCFWRLELKKFVHKVSHIRLFVVDIGYSIKDHQRYGVSNGEAPTQMLVYESSIQLANVATTLVKLSNLFFAKLSTRGINRKRLAYSTEMSSQQIESLAEFIGKVEDDIDRLIGLIGFAYEGTIDDLAELSQDLVNIALKLKSRFDLPLHLILLHLLPLVPDTDPGSPTRSYYKDWFATWNTQRILATENFINLAKSLKNNP